MIDELLHLTAPLADQSDHHDIGRGVFGHHAHQHTFTNAAAGEQTESLSAPHSNQGIDCAYSHIQGFADRVALERIDVMGCKVEKIVTPQGTGVIQRLPQAIDHPAQQTGADTHSLMGGNGNHPGAGLQTFDALDRHQVDNVVVKADHFRLDLPTVPIDDLALATDGYVEADGLQSHAHRAGQATFGFRFGRLGYADGAEAAQSVQQRRARPGRCRCIAHGVSSPEDRLSYSSPSGCTASLISSSSLIAESLPNWRFTNASSC